MNTEKNYVVITFDRHGQFDGPPYLATEEEAINDCLEFNIGHCGFDGESEQLTEDIGKVEDLLKKKQYKEAWELWVDLELIDECSRHMGWYELGKKEKTHE